MSSKQAPNTYNSGDVNWNQLPSFRVLVSSSRSYRKHLCALSWGMITFSRGVTIRSRASTGTWYGRAHPCLGETFAGSRYGSFFVRTQKADSARWRATAPIATEAPFRLRTRT